MKDEIKYKYFVENDPSLDTTQLTNNHRLLLDNILDTLDAMDNHQGLNCVHRVIDEDGKCNYCDELVIEIV